jgi:hypothetical protein
MRHPTVTEFLGFTFDTAGVVGFVVAMVGAGFAAGLAALALAGFYGRR